MPNASGPLLLLCLSVLAAGCFGSSFDVARAARFDHRCPSMTIVEQDGDRYRLRGCGKEVVYACAETRARRYLPNESLCVLSKERKLPRKVASAQAGVPTAPPIHAKELRAFAAIGPDLERCAAARSRTKPLRITFELHLSTKGAPLAAKVYGATSASMRRCLGRAARKVRLSPTGHQHLVQHTFLLR